MSNVERQEVAIEIVVSYYRSHYTIAVNRNTNLLKLLIIQIDMIFNFCIIKKKFLYSSSVLIFTCFESCLTYPIIADMSSLKLGPIVRGRIHTKESGLGDFQIIRSESEPVPQTFMIQS